MSRCLAAKFDRGFLPAAKYAWLAAAYLPAFVFLPHLLNAFQRSPDFGFPTPAFQLGGSFPKLAVTFYDVAAHWAAGGSCQAPQFTNRRRCTDGCAAILFCSVIGALLLFFFFQRRAELTSAEHTGFFEWIVLWGVIAPLIGLIRDVEERQCPTDRPATESYLCSLWHFPGSPLSQFCAPRERLV